MERGRQNGCPVNVRDWLICILDKAYTEGERWVRIYGISSLKRSTDSETQDGSADTDVWQEPYVTKRSASLRLEGRALADAATGERDEGQSLLDAYAEQAGCEGDASIRMVDPYGHAMAADYVVTAVEAEADDTENGVAWELKQVGPPEALPYVQVQAVALETDGQTAETLTLRTGDAPCLVAVKFTPENASNRRFRVRVSGKQHAAVSALAEDSFRVTALSAGEALIAVSSMNGGKTASLRVRVTE